MAIARLNKKQKIAIVTAALVLGIGGTAFAYWTQMGSGTGGAGTGTTVGLVVNQTNTVTDLYPGGAPQALLGNFDNPNTAAVTIGAVSASVTETSVAGCLPEWYAITGISDPASQTVPAGIAQGAWAGLNVAMLEDTDNQDLCKTATITITYAVAAA